MRRHRKKPYMFLFLLLLLLVVAWWISGEIYKPYPPATPTITPGFWPTRVTATIVPSATPTAAIHTPVQPTIGYTETPIIPPVTVTSTPIPQPTITATPIPVVYPAQIQQDYECELWIFRGSRVLHYIRCRLLEPRHRISPVPFTGSPIFIP